MVNLQAVGGMEDFNMMSHILRDARKYEETMEKQIAREARPDFHLSARVGWMNDPNGFSYYDGKYHMFYQYHPYDCHWGPMHWGHAVSASIFRLRWLQMSYVIWMDVFREAQLHFLMADNY